MRKFKPHVIEPATTDLHVMTTVAGRTVWAAPPAGGGGDPGGGSGGVAFALDAPALHPAYGDDFSGTELDPKWTRGGVASATKETSDGTGLKIAGAPTTDNGLWRYLQPAPNGDFSIVMRMAGYNRQQGMMGPVMLNSVGNGVASSAYTAAATYYLWNVAGYAYSTTGPSHDPLNSLPANNGVSYWIRLRKIGTSFYSDVSLDGEGWLTTAGPLTYAGTISQIGFASILAVGRAPVFKALRFNVLV